MLRLAPNPSRAPTAACARAAPAPLHGTVARAPAFGVGDRIEYLSASLGQR